MPPLFDGTLAVWRGQTAPVHRVRFIRFLLLCLSLVIALAAILVASAFVPAVQTWIVERALARQPGMRASVGSVSAGFSNVGVADVRLERDGAVLTLPALEAALPLKAALWNRKVRIAALVAKGWTLDLSGRPGPTDQDVRGSGTEVVASGDGSVVTAQTQKVARIVRRLLGGWELPGDVSLDGVDLEGNVLLATPSGKEPTRVHVTIKGGGLTAGRVGNFALDAAGPVEDPRLLANAYIAHGRLVVAMGSPRSISRVEFNGSLTSEGGVLPEKLGLEAGVAAAGGAGDETCTLELSRGGRRLAIIAAGLPQAAHRLAGTWKIDLQDSDVARLFRDRALPTFAAAGEGSFDSDAAFSRVHATGRLKAVASHLGVVAAPLDRLGAVSLDAGFEVTHGGQFLRVDRLDFAVGGNRPIAVAHTLQPFNLDEKTGDLKTADPNADWVEGSLHGLPLAWLTGTGDGLALGGGDATGDFVVKAANGGFALRSKAPLVASGVSVARAGQMLAQGLDLSLTMLAEKTVDGWQAQGAPLMVSSSGRRLATFEAKVSSPTGADGRISMAGTWNADLEALAAQPALFGAQWIKGRSASGEFFVNFGRMTEVKGKLTMFGHTPDRTVTMSMRGSADAYGGVAFHAPVTIALGAGASDFSADGTWTREKAGGRRLDLELVGVNVALEHLGLLAGSLPVAGGVALPEILAAAPGGPRSLVPVRDQRPFWGDWIGRVRVECYRLQVGTHELNEVAGTFDVDHGSIRLTGGRAAFAPPPSPPKTDRLYSQPKAEAPRSAATAEGSLSFDAAAEFPYNLKATAAADAFDAARLLGSPQGGRDPVIEGRFAVAGTLTGNGVNLADLVDRRREEFRLSGKGGIIRLLKTTVAESIPEAPSRVSDALVGVGSVVGSLFGVKGTSLSSGKNPISKEAEAVLDFTYEIPEIRYDEMTVTAIRGADGAVRLDQIAITAANERLTGSGQIGGGKGLPLRAQPLSLELQLGARGAIAGFLSTAGLLAGDKDAQGFTMLRQSIHFGGTLEHINESQWHDLLVKAATQPPKHAKKGG